MEEGELIMHDGKPCSAKRGKKKAPAKKKAKAKAKKKY
tara:strand:+ start:368 stop:481 length:114 start_codon:yes stop_codon:yes gene_type:complete